ncbi:four helix bundle protein [Patescibacteria group bacterium]|nr:four helix bundle protein [Patescibacteria group bacterium]
MDLRNCKKIYDLESRTLLFAKAVRNFVKALPYNMVDNEYAKQVIRSSGSIGANYIEANESLGKKDLIMRARIAKKESKETIYWLKLIDVNNEEKNNLIQEATELMKILGSIIEKCQNKQLYGNR